MLTGSRRITVAAVVTLALATTAAAVSAQTAPAVTTPKQHFGFTIGDDYQLATYTQFVAYWQKLDKESDRMKVVEIGKTAEGRPQLMAIITSPENHKKLDRYKEISAKLARAEGVTDEQARALAKEGKGVVWFDGGLHATEVLGAHQLIETVYQLVSRSDAETAPLPQRSRHPRGARESRRHGARLELVHARVGSDAPFDGRPATALPEVHRPRQQPRFLHVDRSPRAPT